ncbi:MAG: SPOR domain-containing protein [Bacteroidota bacterium]
MKIKLLLLIIALIFSFQFLTFNSFAQTSELSWIKSAGAIATSSALDASGNTYVAGWFKSSTVTFGSATLKNNDNTGNSSDIFLAKYDTGKNTLWAKNTGGARSDRATSVAVAASGYIYVAGEYQSPTITFGSSTLKNTDNTGNSSDIFLVKYDAGGNVLWAKSAGGNNSDSAFSVTVDASGYIYIVGCFQGNSITFGSTSLSNTGTSDFFQAEYDEGGNALLAKRTLKGNIVKNIEYVVPVTSTSQTTNTNTNSTNNITSVSNTNTTQTTTSVNSTNNNTVTNITVTTTTSVKKFFIIAGSYTTAQLANDAVAVLKTKGYADAEVVGKNDYGSYRVAYKGYATKADATKDFTAIKQNINSSAWIFEKK